MKVNVAKWGNSLGIRIPQAFAEQIGLQQGGQVELRLERGGVLMRPKKFNLETLLSKVKAGNIHAEVDTGTVRGREEW